MLMRYLFPCRQLQTLQGCGQITSMVPNTLFCLQKNNATDVIFLLDSVATDDIILPIKKH